MRFARVVPSIWASLFWWSINHLSLTIKGVLQYEWFCPARSYICEDICVLFRSRWPESWMNNLETCVCVCVRWTYTCVPTHTKPNRVHYFLEELRRFEIDVLKRLHNITLEPAHIRIARRTSPGLSIYFNHCVFLTRSRNYYTCTSCKNSLRICPLENSLRAFINQARMTCEKMLKRKTKM